MSKSDCLTISRLHRLCIAAFLFGLFALTLPIAAQSQTLRNGRVTEEGTGEQLEGATVLIKGTARATTTNEEGVFSILANNSDILVISRVGEETVEVNVGARSVINVTLRMVATGGDEVIVTGYRTLRKSDVTGSITQLSGNDLQKAPVANFAQALEGRVPGLQIQFPDGQPGEEPTFIMRGPNSLNNSPQPLYVIDGFQMESFNPAAMNMDDIENIAFLKDASSVAQYGARGANGVVIITTKTGRISRPTLAFNASYGFNSNRKKMELMSPYEFITVNNYWITDPTTRAQTINKFFADGKTVEDYKDVQGVDYQDYIFTKGRVSRYNMSLRGGNETTKYLVSGGYFDEEGSIVYTGSKSYNARINMENTITSKLKLNFIGDYAGVKRIGPFVRQGIGGTYNTSTTLMYRVWSWMPLPFPGINVDELINESDEDVFTASDLRISPITDYKNQELNYLTNSFNGTVAATYTINKTFTFKSTFTDRYTLVDNSFFYNEKTAPGRYRLGVNEGGPWGGYTKINVNSIINENQLLIKPTLSKNHTFTTILVQGIQSSKSRGMGYNANFLPLPQLGLPGLDQGENRGMTSYLNEDSRVWYLGRADYSFKSKYVFNTSLRAEGSSKFLGNNKWGYFPSFGFAWNMDKEGFMKRVNSVISTSKLRFTYGSSGNDRIGYYDAFDQLVYSRNGYPFNNSLDVGSVSNSTLRNEALKWETTTGIDLGYEVGFFKERVKLDVTLYQKRTKDLLYRVILSPSSGYGSAFKNIGSLENKGIEVELNTLNVKTKDFQWRTSFNITTNKNRITFLQEDARSMLYSVNFESNFGNLYIQNVGQPTGLMIGYVSDGLYQLSDFYNPAPNVYTLKEGIPINNASNPVGPGAIKYKDLNGDMKIDANDLTIIGRGQPLHFGGFANTVTYKRITLYALLSWVYGNNIYNANRHTFEGNSNVRPFINQFKTFENRWTLDNQNTDIQTLSRATAGRAGFYTSQYVEDGSFLRLRTVNLDYALPARWLKKVALTNLNVYFSGQNLLTWTNYSGLDPQVSVSGNQVLGPGFDYSAYPAPRTYTFGIRASF